MATFTPQSWRGHARPIPREAPVIRAVLPSSGGGAVSRALENARALDSTVFSHSYEQNLLVDFKPLRTTTA
jgi:hypothetical protein